MSKPNYVAALSAMEELIHQMKLHMAEDAVDARIAELEEKQCGCEKTEKRAKCTDCKMDCGNSTWVPHDSTDADMWTRHNPHDMSIHGIGEIPHRMSWEADIKDMPEDYDAEDVLNLADACKPAFEYLMRMRGRTGKNLAIIVCHDGLEIIDNTSEILIKIDTGEDDE